MESKIPILLLKTKSTPSDAYEELFSKPHGNLAFEPRFIPVLQHKFQDDGIGELETLLRDKRIGNGADCACGGIIFTSQRAVEAFAKVVGDGQGIYTRHTYNTLHRHFL
jgi:uroporphyrinogen-III synthase